MMIKKIIDRAKSGKGPYLIIFTITGGIAGFLYWKFVGCNTGSCPIKSNWYLMTAYGLVFGYLAGDLISGFILKRKSRESKEQ
ncbi:MAG: hypothetical protein U5K32_12135 [Bacteroidales bacterium]|nr:hypothetical protein [Bacteroidales bacterium]